MPEFTQVRCVGMYHRGPEAVSIADALQPGDELTLERDPMNPYDPNAVKVICGDTWIGFIERGVAAFLAHYLDEGTTYIAQVEGHNGQYPLLTIREHEDA